jgi:hypothetical protein
LTGLYNVTDLQTERLQREMDELRAQFNDLAHLVNQYVASLQDQIDGKVNAEAKFQP